MSETEMHWKINVFGDEESKEEEEEKKQMLFSVNNVVSIVSEIIMGTTLRKPDYQKMPPPLWSSLKSGMEEEEEGGAAAAATMVTGASFKKRVVETGVDVLILVTARFCGHCQRFQPIWEMMKRRVMDSVSTLELLQMNGEMNEVQGLVVESYPSLFLFKALDKSTPVMYKGSFVVAEEIVDWSLRHVSVKFRKELLLNGDDIDSVSSSSSSSSSSAGAVVRDEL